MDHFPLPEGRQHIRVPNATFEEYSQGDGGFLGYPARKGWSQEELRGKSSFGERSPKDVQAFFQTWLYFGCLIEVFRIAGVKSTTADFLDAEKRFVTTKNLPSKLREWRGKVKESKGRNAERSSGVLLTETRAILAVLSDYINYYCETAAVPEGNNIAQLSGVNWPVSEEIRMSVMALGFTLGEAVSNLEGPSSPSTKFWRFSPLLKNCMLQAGWCPTHVQRSLTDLGIDGHYYIAASRNPQGTQRHVNCTEDICSANSINEETYVTKHTDECWVTNYCNDEHVSVDMKRVIRIIQSGWTPVVSWNATEDRLDLKEFRGEKGHKIKYITISHVWSDGMGNPKKNSLPKCHVLRLQKMVDGLKSPEDSAKEPLHFWMDTLCIPVEDKYKRFRYLSIGRMKEIYNSSAATLVVESELTKLRSTATVYEKSLHIYFSSWNQRLWTFHEGMRAKKLMIQFEDKALSYRDDNLDFHAESIQSCVDGHCVTFPNKATSSTMGEFVILYDFLNQGLFSETYQSLAPMVGAIQHRATSKLADQTICALNILGEDASEVLDLNSKLKGKELEEARMEVFLNFLGKVPHDIIFNICPRMQKEGFRWAARSFLNVPKNGFLRDVEGEPGVIKKGQGLVCKSPGFLLGSTSRSGLIPGIFDVTIPQKGRNPLNVSIRVLRDKYEPNDLNWDPSERYAVLMKAPFHEAQAVNGPYPRNAVLGSIQDIDYDQSGEPEQIRLRHECLAVVTLLNPSDFPRERYKIKPNNASNRGSLRRRISFPPSIKDAEKHSRDTAPPLPELPIINGYYLDGTRAPPPAERAANDNITNKSDKTKDKTLKKVSTAGKDGGEWKSTVQCVVLDSATEWILQ